MDRRNNQNLEQSKNGKNITNGAVTYSKIYAVVEHVQSKNLDILVICRVYLTQSMKTKM